MNILISGTAGDIGLGASRILKEWGIFKNLYGMDVKKEHSSKFLFKKCCRCPAAKDKSYIFWVKSFIEQHSIDLFIPTSEAEINLLNNLNLKKIGKALLLINNKFTIKYSLDKYKTLFLLNKKGISVPKNGIVGKTSPLNFPVIVKPRYGRGSKNIRLVKNEKSYKVSSLGYVWQEYLLPASQEYTCPVYSNNNERYTTLIMRRKMEGGRTVSGVVVKNKYIESYINKIARVIKLKGSINIQLRLTVKGPILFEINPRLSGTLVFRDIMGFTDLRWWVSDLFGLKSKVYKPPKIGTKFYRDSSEYIKYSLKEMH